MLPLAITTTRGNEGAAGGEGRGREREKKVLSVQGTSQPVVKSHPWAKRQEAQGSAGMTFLFSATAKLIDYERYNAPAILCRTEPLRM